jgi:Laminin G domain
LWLTASSTDVARDPSGRVTAWTDRSQRGRKVIADYPRVEGRLELVDVGVPFPAVRFLGDFAQTGVLVVPEQATIKSFILLFVFAHNNDQKGFVISSPNGYASWLMADGSGSLSGGVISNDGTGQRLGATSPSSGWNDGKFHVVSVRRDNAQQAAFLRVDGEETRSNTPLNRDEPANGDAARIGGIAVRPSQGAPGVTYPLAGLIAEVIEAEVADAADLAGLATYIRDRYGLTY